MSLKKSDLHMKKSIKKIHKKNKSSFPINLNR